LEGGRYGDLNINFDIDFPKKLDEEEKELLSSVLDEEEIAKIEQMILKRSISDNLNKLNRVSAL
jgi:DnaJ-class molecular chaperone